MSTEENPADSRHTTKNQFSTSEADEERAKEIDRLRSMTVEEKFEQLERLYLERQKIKLTDEERATRETEKEEIRERWHRLRLAYQAEQ